VPSAFVSGRQDWGVCQRVGSLDTMRAACARLDGVDPIEGAGRWVQQEQPEATVARRLAFLRRGP
jgi:pimeloyl-ACP methyl ester carboxylesterase